MALSTQGRQGRDRLPRDIRAPGPLRNDAVVGRILFLESRSLGPADTTGEGAVSQVGASGTGKGKKGSGKGKKGNGARSDAVLEITLCGGKSPADVMMFQAWEPDVRTRLREAHRFYWELMHFPVVRADAHLLLAREPGARAL